MNLLLDTHCLICYLEGSQKLPDKIRREIISPNNSKAVSIVSLFEIAPKQNIKKLEIPFTIEQIELMLLGANVDVIPIKISHLHYLSKNTFEHKDPFDKYIITTAMVDEYVVLSKDREFTKYNVSVLWD